VAALSIAGADRRFDPARFAPALRRAAFEAGRAITAAKARQAVPAAGLGGLLRA
jgi:hypothetical protein